ncbi:hypothetical protein EVAR_83584_1 [Eumeta japonica]|uniref:Uncharacterized protein n=1 Tax=Eumeta variegata TaxID=151549 RepID=A0A4C1UNF1_EUMVA|nr:hypothetical protein EVAR_83584_1 [Eumeta japonica]
MTADGVRRSAGAGAGKKHLSGGTGRRNWRDRGSANIARSITRTCTDGCAGPRKICANEKTETTVQGYTPASDLSLSPRRGAIARKATTTYRRHVFFISHINNHDNIAVTPERSQMKPKVVMRSKQTRSRSGGGARTPAGCARARSPVTAGRKQYVPS